MYRLIVLILFFPNTLLACLWQSSSDSGLSPFWLSNSIEVCFAPPRPEDSLSVGNPLDQEYRETYQRNIALIKRTLESQINGKSSFNLYGFGYCPQSELTSTSSNLPRKIRIDLNTLGDGGDAGGIGPINCQRNHFVAIGTVRTDYPPGFSKATHPANQPFPERVRTFNDARHISYVGLHEVMHTLGFFHTGEWDQPLTDPRGATGVIQFGASRDDQSIMNGARNYDSRGLAQLSDTDVACLQHVANKTITQYPSRSPNLGEQASDRMAPQVPATSIQ